MSEVRGTVVAVGKTRELVVAVFFFTDFSLQIAKIKIKNYLNYVHACMHILWPQSVHWENDSYSPFPLQSSHVGSNFVSQGIVPCIVNLPCTMI